MLHYTINEENTSPEFVSLQAAKDHLRVNHPYEDNLIGPLVQAAIRSAENYTGTFLRHRTVYIHSDRFPKCVPLEYGPLRSLSMGIWYYDPENTQQGYDNSNYSIVQGYGKKPELVFTGQDSFPQVYNRHDAVLFSFQAGYQEQLPEPVYQAVLLTLADFYEYREDRKAIINTRAMALLRPYKKWG